jgi:hypothetical protein
MEVSDERRAVKVSGVQDFWCGVTVQCNTVPYPLSVFTVRGLLVTVSIYSRLKAERRWWRSLQVSTV